jgi:hypothetical protein
MLSLNSTVEELVPVFHEYRIFWPPVVLTVTNCTVPEQAVMEAGAGTPATFGGGAVLTYTVALPLEVPPVGQEVLPIAVTV